MAFYDCVRTLSITPYYVETFHLNFGIHSETHTDIVDSVYYFIAYMLCGYMLIRTEVIKICLSVARLFLCIYNQKYMVNHVLKSHF